MDTTHKLVSDTPGSLREDDLTAVQGTADVKENTDNQMENETASLKSADKTQTRFIVATSPSDSHEDSHLTPVKDEANARCFVPFWGLVFCVMTFFGLMCSFALRVGLSVAIVAMVNQTAVTEDVEMSNATNTSGTDQCPLDPALQHTDTDGEFTWDRHQQATALAAYYYGYIITPIPGGWLADRFGGKFLFGVSVLGSSVISLLTPAAARLHLGVFLLLRVLSGLSAGFEFPGMHALIARWSAPKNRSLVVAVIIVGTDAGAILGMLLSGVLCDYGFAGGWPSVFYVFGMLGCVWSGAWYLLVYDSPSTHPRISKAELEYWEKEIGSVDLVARPPTPWRKMFTSVPVWALGVAFFACSWVFYVVVICIPLFMHDVLGFDTTKNGLLSAVPFMANLSMIPAGWFADWLRSPGRMSTNVVRKIFYATGFCLVACFIILTGYVGCNRALAVVFMVLALASQGISFTVVTINQLDLAPLHAGKIMGLTAFMGKMSSVAVPHVVGALTYHRSTHAEWQSVFFVAAGVYALGTIVFVVFGSGHRQSWADKQPRDSTNDNKPETIHRYSGGINSDTRK